MNIINPSIEILDDLNQDAILKKLELAGRVCYKSEGRITENSAETFISSIIDRGHESVLEHASFSVRFIVDRGVTHEMVRHRLASYSQESTRYCNYGKDDFGGEITVIAPSFFVSRSFLFWLWKKGCQFAEEQYFALLKDGATPQEARGVLPHSLKTEIIMTANIREWRHFLNLRSSKAAHPQIREVSIMLLKELKRLLPALFQDIEILEAE